MNIPYVEAFLTNCLGSSPEFVVEQNKKLLLEIKEYNNKERATDSIYSMMSILDRCDKEYVILLDEFQYVIKNGTNLQKIDKIQEILMKTSSTLYYYTDILDRKDLMDLSCDKKDGNYVRRLTNRKEYFKEQIKYFISQLTTYRELSTKERVQIQLDIERLKKEG